MFEYICKYCSCHWECCLCLYYFDSMQRFTTMVFCSLPRTIAGYGFPVNPTSQCLPVTTPVTCLHDKFPKGRILDTSATSSSICFASLSYRRHVMRQLHVSCRRDSHGTRHDKPDEQLVNICLFISFYIKFTFVSFVNTTIIFRYIEHSLLLQIKGCISRLLFGSGLHLAVYLIL